MAEQLLIMAFSAAVASLAQPMTASTPVNPAPAGTAETRYCMHVGPLTGRLAETIECWTREEWADQGVDVDKEWAKEGVRTIG